MKYYHEGFWCPDYGAYQADVECSQCHNTVNVREMSAGADETICEDCVFENYWEADVMALAKEKMEG